MKKNLLSIAALFVMSSSVFAGGLITNTNQNVAFLRNVARDATTEIDAVYSNPAGLAFMKEDGFHISLNNQSAFQTRSIVTTFQPFMGYGGDATKTFEGKATVPFIPSLQAVYKKDKWTASFNFAIVGGGGQITFDKGLPSFESQVAYPVGIYNFDSQNPFPSTTYSLDSRLEGSSIVYGLQLGATYKINDYLSAFVGGRVNIAKNGYEGYLRNVQLSEETNYVTYFGAKAAGAKGVSSLMQNIAASKDGAGNATLNNLVAGGALQQAQLDQMASNLGLSSEAFGTLTVDQAKDAFDNAAAQADRAAALPSTDMEVDCQQSGLGIAPILGFNFKYDRLNVGIKYEFKTSMDIENKTKKNTTGVASFNDGVKTPNDIPALLTFGVQYEIIPEKLRASAGFHLFFDKDAKMEGNKQDHLDHNTYEILFGLEWNITEKILVSAGMQRTQYGVTDEYQKDMNFSLSSFSYGFGGAYMITEKMRLNVACFFTDYDKYTKESANYNGMPLSGKDVFERTNLAFGLGIDYRF